MTEPTSSPIDRERWKRIEDLFHRARELDEASLDVFSLAKECADDPELGQTIRRLVLADTRGEALVDRSLEDLAAPLLTGPALREPVELEPGTRVGRYRILETLGAGGMGTVYRAERADGAYHQQAALKVVRTGRLGDEAIRRLRLERQILARLDHPGIATLLDGGLTDDGLPYFAMELVSGSAITRYAERLRLSTRARVDLMLQVVDAVDFAHRRLVVHRDLKPSNIFVTDEGTVRLLDFGIARLLRRGGRRRAHPNGTLPPDSGIRGSGADPG